MRLCEDDDGAGVGGRIEVASTGPEGRGGRGGEGRGGR